MFTYGQFPRYPALKKTLGWERGIDNYFLETTILLEIVPSLTWGDAIDDVDEIDPDLTDIVWGKKQTQININTVTDDYNRLRKTGFNRVSPHSRRPAIFVFFERLSCRQLHVKELMLLIIIFADGPIHLRVLCSSRL